MGFEPIRHIVSRSLRSPQATRDLQIARIWDTARRVIDKLWGEDRSTYISFISFKEGALKCETTSPAAKQQFNLDAPRIKNEINRLLGEPMIKSIVIHGKGF